MSKQVGLIRLKGNLSGISFYKSGGLDLARTASGPSRERIDSDPAFTRTRENNKEFGGAATAGKAFRLAFADAVHTMGDRYMASRLTKLFKEINLRGTGTRGQRSISLSDNRFMLMNMEFNATKSFSSVFNAPYTLTHTAERTDATLMVNNLVAQTYISAPAGATHFRLVVCIGVVSDYVFDSGTNSYEPFDPEANTLSASKRSAMMLLSDASAQSVTVTASLLNPPVLPAEVSTVAAVGIEFYQQVNGVDYLLAQGCSMKVADVF